MDNQFISAVLKENNHISVSFISDDVSGVTFSLVKDNVSFPLKKESVKNHNQIFSIDLVSEEPIELGHVYKIKTNEDDDLFLRYDYYVTTNEFASLYTYNGKLGLEYSKEESIFRLWSPLSEKINLKIENGENSFLVLPMKRKENGVFSIRVKGDLLLKKYKYVIYQNNLQKEINDPYGKAVGLNSETSVVIDINDVLSLGTIKPKTKMNSYSDAIIYELHIRDFTEGDKKITDSGTYLSILKKVDYLKQLGITHIQILPVIDFDDVDDIEKDRYNWGYNPISFFALEGSYSAYPESGLARLLEFKTLVNELHKNDIRVVMDVVYNHLYDYITTDFQKNVPYYYFRRNGKKMANASGCGNDVASERSMVRRIICDSIRYFLEVFDVDGFRFDLLGLIDIDTSKEIVRIRDEVKKDAILYGEGWNMGVELKAEQKTSSDNSHLIPEMGFFNDKFREVIKGSTFEKYSPGYILGNTNNYFDIDDSLFGGLLSNRYASSNQSINYVECHDNQTLFDKVSYFDDNLDTCLKRVKLANAITILSYGVPFIHMGQEIGLSKELLDNTYNIPKINNMNWELVEERKDMVNYLSDLIKVRKSLNYASYNNLHNFRDNIEVNHLPNGLLTVKIKGKDLLIDSQEALILINPTEENLVIELEDYYKHYFSRHGIVKGESNFVKSFLIPGLALEIVTK